MKKKINVSGVVAGIDFGTTSCAAVFYDSTTGLTNGASIATPKVGNLPEKRHEFDISKLAETLRGILGEKAKAVTHLCVGQFQHSLVLLDVDYAPVHAGAVLWCDERAADMVDEIKGKADIRGITGNDVYSGLILAKAYWFSKKMPDVWKKVRWICTLADYLGYLLTGKLVLSRSDGMCNNILTRDGKVAVEVFRALGLNPEIIPEVVATGNVVGNCNTEFAGSLGLGSQCVYHSPLADNHSGKTGLGSPNDAVTLSFGSSGTGTATNDSWTHDGQYHRFDDFGKVFLLTILVNSGLAWTSFKGCMRVAIKAKTKSNDNVDKTLDRLAMSGKPFFYLDDTLLERFLPTNTGFTVHNAPSDAALNDWAISVLQSITFGMWERAIPMLDAGITKVCLTGDLANSSIIQGLIYQLANGRKLEVLKAEGSGFNCAKGALIAALASATKRGVGEIQEHLCRLKPIKPSWIPTQVVERFDGWTAIRKSLGKQ
ncbi:hypothetical protein J4401_01210 [Candidatus Woesearchaeota archaeon]|nr:hypothetical protein [Candidatus Woesearchaeota archaeon]